MEKRFGVEIIQLNEAYSNNWQYLFNRMRHAPRGLIDKLKGGLSAIAKSLGRAPPAWL